MAFKVPEQYRVKNISPEGELYGIFKVPRPENVILCIVATDGSEGGMGWEHVSVHARNKNKPLTPTWDEMCLVKSLFWDDEDCVIQFHPPKSQYVNVHPHVLHLWRKSGQNWETPPKILIG